MRDNGTENSSKIKNLTYVGIFAALICVCSWTAIPLTVSVTLQTFAVCLAAGLLGFKRGTAAVAVYILLGCVGLPVFTGFKGGISVVAGPTGGYIAGFLITAAVVGFALERTQKKLWQCVLFMSAGVIACYIFGTLWFSFAYRTPVSSALAVCVYPFLAFDAVKIFLASVLVGRLKRFIR